MKTVGKATDLITFSRSSGGTALRKISYGPELVTNGTFDTDSDWTKGAGWTISGGAAVSNNASGFGDVRQDLSLTANKIYRLEFLVTSYTSGVVKPYLGSSGNTLAEPYERGNLTAGLTATSAGAFYAFFVYDASQVPQILFRSNNGFFGSIDNISVKEVLFDQADGDLVVFNHPADIPRIEYAADGSVKGLLVEESRTNLLTYSEDFSNAYWPKADVTVSASSVVDPTGGTNAYELVESATTANHLLNRTIVAGSGTYSGFIYAKANTRHWMRLQSQSPLSSWVNVNLLTGEKGLSGGAEDFSSVENVGNGWYKISLGFTATASTGPQIFVLDSDRGGSSAAYTGDGTSSILIYGAQLEAGAFPTSYIPTSGSTATRAADVASIATSAFGYRADEGTVVVEADASVIGTNRLYSLHHDAATDDAIYGYAGVNGHLIIRSNAVTEAAIDAGDMAVGVMSKVAGGFKLNSTAASIDGGAVVTDTSAAMPAVTATVLTIGGRYLTPASNLNGHIKSIKYYPRRLTNAQLQELTT